MRGTGADKYSPHTKLRRPVRAGMPGGKTGRGTYDCR